LAQETRDVHHQFVDFLRSAAKELAERQLDLRRAEREFHQVRLEGEELPKVEQAALKLGLKESEKFLERDKPADVLEAMGLPALAALLGPKSEADVDQAANELLKAAGLTPTGKARLRAGRSGEFFSSAVNGRSRVYEAIVKGQNLPKPGIPESFNVLVKELQALGLKVTLGTTEDVEE